MTENYDLEFKKIYNKLEEYISDKYKTKDNISDEVLQKDEFRNDFCFWKKYRNLRNIIIHNECITHITKNGLEIFRKKVDNILNPILASKICIKNIFTATADSNLNDVLCEMKKSSYSNVPVINNSKEVIGIFNYYTLFLFFGNHQEAILLETNKLKIGEFKKYYLKDCNADMEFKFISRHDNLKEINKIYNSIISNGKQMGALLVTENGKQKEKLLGIITAEDIIKANIN